MFDTQQGVNISRNYLFIILLMIPSFASASNFFRDRLRDYSCIDLLVPIAGDDFDARLEELAPIRYPYLTTLNADPRKNSHEEFEWRHGWLEWSQMLWHLKSNGFPRSDLELNPFSTLNMVRNKLSVPEVWLSTLHPSFDERTGRVDRGEFVIELQTKTDATNMIEDIFAFVLEEHPYNLLTAKTKTISDTFVYSALIDMEGSAEQRFLATFKLFEKIVIEVEAQEGLGVF